MELYLSTLGFSGWQLGNASAVAAEETGRPGLPARGECLRLRRVRLPPGQSMRCASGGRDLVLVVGLEKMTDVTDAEHRYWLGVSGDTEWERLPGLTFAGVYGLMASRYEAEHGGSDALSAVAVKNHANGALNPNAHFQEKR